MNLILDLGRNMKLILALTLCMIPLDKIVEIKYKYDF